MVQIGPQVSSACTCGRTARHVHYSRTHVLLVQIALVLVAVTFGLAFITGAVQGSTKLLLPIGEQLAYQTVTEKISELMRPYERWKPVLIIIDLAALVLVIATALTLRSFARKEDHTAITISASIFWFVDISISAYYAMITDEALRRLPSLVDSGVLEIAMRVQREFDAANGFWGSPLEQAIRGLLSLVGVAVIIGAAFTSTSIRVWQPETALPAVQPQKQPTSSTAVTQTGTNQLEVPRMRFCRYCGVKIPRESKFCEECGKKLVE